MWTKKQRTVRGGLAGWIPFFRRSAEGLNRLLEEDVFRRTLILEARRWRRQGPASLLMVLDVEPIVGDEAGGRVLERIARILVACTRETDAKGWLAGNTAIGVLLTGLADEMPAVEDLHRTVFGRVWRELKKVVPPSLLATISVSYSEIPWGGERLPEGRPVVAVEQKRRGISGSQVALGEAV
jgi:hypothetical protein